MEQSLSLSFCITCKNRIRQIQETLPVNLENNRKFKEFIDFVLVDFGSTDGLQDWITSDFMHEIEEGYLKYYYTEELTVWHSSIAKNTAHALATGDILVNLDCDNFTGPDGGMFVLDKMAKYGYPYTIIHQFSNEFGDGSFGRIALSKHNFLALGGYDEDMEAMAYQDNDLLIRAVLTGLSYIHLPDPEFNRAIPNDKSESLKNTSSGLSWKEMRDKNFVLSTKNISQGQFRANTDRDFIGITDHISTFVDDDYYSTNTMQLLPIGGLCNRMRAIDSAICLAKEINFDLTVYWEPNRSLNCPFELLFYPIEGIEIKTIRANTFRSMGDGTYDLYNTNVFRKYESVKYIGAKELIKAEDREAFIRQQLEGCSNIIIESGVRFFPNNNPYSLFRPVPSIQKRIDERIGPFNRHTIGVHIRRTDNEKSITHSPVELFIEAIEKEISINPSANFYLATDDVSVKENFVKKFGKRMMTDWTPVDRCSIEGIQDAVVELYSLSATSKILGSYWSSFSKTAADISGIPLRIIKGNQPDPRLTTPPFSMKEEMKDLGRIHLCTFADSRFDESRKRIIRQAESMDLFEHIYTCDEQDPDETFKKKFESVLCDRIRGYGYWVWKPYVIFRTLSGIDENDVLLYVDMGCHLNNKGLLNFIKYWRQVKYNDSGFLVFESYADKLECKWTKGDVLDFFKVRYNPLITHTPQYQAGIIFIRKNSHTLSLIKQWLDIFYDHFSLADDSTSLSPNMNGFIENRHDQSILSVLLKMQGASVISNRDFLYLSQQEKDDSIPILIKRDLC